MPSDSGPNGVSLTDDGVRNRADILIVEDELVVACDIGDMLEELGFHVVDAVATGEGAVERARTLQPAVILMDIRLAGAIDGVDAARQIRNESDVPIVFLSAHSDNILVRRAMATNPCCYLVKPVRMPELRGALQIALRSRASVRTRARR